MTMPEIERRNGKPSKYRKKVDEMDFPCRAGGSKTDVNETLPEVRQGGGGVGSWVMIKK